MPALVIPPPTLEERVAAWRSGNYEDHPVGGYDEIIRKLDETSYFRRGVRHRTDGPAETTFRHGKVWAETWWFRGAQHREDGPAVTLFRSDGSLYEERWMREDFHHRDDGPAVVQYEVDGAVAHEEYRVDGRVSRLDGPAIRLQGNDGTWTETFHVHGEYFTAEEHARLREALDSGAPLEWARSYAKGAEA